MCLKCDVIPVRSQTVTEFGCTVKPALRSWVAPSCDSATGIGGFVRSVLNLADYSLFNRETALVCPDKHLATPETSGAQHTNLKDGLQIVALRREPGGPTRWEFDRRASWERATATLSPRQILPYGPNTPLRRYRGGLPIRKCRSQTEKRTRRSKTGTREAQRS